MRLFEIDYKRLLLLLLPTFLRQPRLSAFLEAMTVPVSKLYDAFIENRTKNLRRIGNNGQVCYLQKLLNDELDRDDGRRIAITDTTGDVWVLVYDEVMPEQLIVCDMTLLYDESAIANNTNIFVVAVPWRAADADKTNKLRDFLNEYKLAGSRYKIIFYE